MKNALIVVLLALSGIGHACASDRQHEVDGSDSGEGMETLLTPGSQLKGDVSTLRAQMLSEGGRTAGFRAGMISRANAIARHLEQKQTQLDKMFQFSTLLQPGGVLPPVVVQAKDVAAFSAEQIRTADHVYRIVKEERFVSVPPTWRDYLLAGLPVQGKPELPARDALPVGASETALWRLAVKAGWADGEVQADAILDANFGRLTRDFTGMLLYSSLRQQGMVSNTRVAEMAQTVTGDRKQMLIGDRLRRLADKAGFVTNHRKWRAKVKGVSNERARASASK